MLHHNFEFENTKLYINFKSEVVKNLKQKLKRGKILLNGANATLFGNGTELLEYIAGKEIVSELKQGQIRMPRFPDEAKLLCARSPHIIMGNLYLVENNLDGGMEVSQEYPFLIMSVVEDDGLINGQPIRKGDHFILPDGFGKAQLQGKMELIASTVA